MAGSSSPGARLRVDLIDPREKRRRDRVPPIRWPGYSNGQNLALLKHFPDLAGSKCSGGGTGRIGPLPDPFGLRIPPKARKENAMNRDERRKWARSPVRAAASVALARNNRRFPAVSRATPARRLCPSESLPRPGEKTWKVFSPEELYPRSPSQFQTTRELLPAPLFDENPDYVSVMAAGTGIPALPAPQPGSPWWPIQLMKGSINTFPREPPL